VTPPIETWRQTSRLAALLDHVARVEDPREVGHILRPLPGFLFLVGCGGIADCDDCEDSPPGARRISTSCASASAASVVCRASAGSPCR
jgi:hypothetical protein